MRYSIKREDEVIETKTLKISGEQNSIKISENEYGDEIAISPAEYALGGKRPFNVVVNDLVLSFENGKLIISRKLDQYTEQFLIQDLDTGKVHWGDDPHVNPKFTGKRRKIKGKNFKDGKPNNINNLKTLRYEVPHLVSEHFMIKY